jgi:dephospho-CoA kinase
VRKGFEHFATKSNAQFVFNEAAILFETGSYKHFDKTILVIAPENLRIERVMKRDNCSASLVKERMNSQWSDKKKTPLADAVIVNDGERSLLSQIEKILIEIA